MKGLSYNKNKPTWKREELSLPLATFFCCCMTSSLRGKKPKEKYKAFFTFPGSKYLTMNTVYITLPPPTQACSFGSCCLEWQIILKVKKCLIIGTYLPHGKVHLWGKVGGKAKKEKEKPTTEEPYGIDIRQGAHTLKPFLWRGKRIGTISFRTKLLQINLTLHFTACLVPKRTS